MSFISKKKNPIGQIITKFSKELVWHQNFVPDINIRNTWSNKIRSISIIESLNIELLAIAYVYLYMKYQDIYINTDDQRKQNISNELHINPIDVNILGNILNNIVTQKGKIDFKLWFDNDEIKNKINIHVATYAIIIVNSM